MSKPITRKQRTKNRRRENAWWRKEYEHARRVLADSQRPFISTETHPDQFEQYLCNPE